MKVRNLILASLAAVAMSACSNEEILDNGAQTPSGETSQMKFGIAFPSDATRASEEVGTVEEYDFSQIAVVITVGSSKSVMTFAKSEFTKSESGNNILYLKNSISVQAGDATLYAFVNPSATLLNSLKTSTAYSTFTESAGYTNSIDALIGTGNIAASKNFLMSNAGGTAVSETFATGAVEEVTISVDRAAVKIEEGSQTTAFDVTDTKVPGSGDLKITLNKYSYANLATTTPVLYKSDFVTTEYFQTIGAFGNGDRWDDYSSKAITGKTGTPVAKGDVTYAMENLVTASSTKVMYEATAVWGNAPAATFYVMADGKVYKSFDEMNAEVQTGLTAESTIEECEKQGIKKYENGKCYYNVAIKTGADAKIVRNNVYKLAVASIAGLGTTTPTPDPDPTTINLTVDIKPWTVNMQEDIVLQ